MTSKSNKKAPILRAQCIALFGGQCEVCGSKENLQFAHIRKTGLNGWGRGRKERIYDVINHPLDYKLTCKEHNDIVEEEI